LYLTQLPWKDPDSLKLMPETTEKLIEGVLLALIDVDKEVCG